MQRGEGEEAELGELLVDCAHQSVCPVSRKSEYRAADQRL